MEAPLPTGWISQFDPKHQRNFYVYTATGQTQWEHPGSHAPPPYAPPAAAPSSAPSSAPPTQDKGMFSNILSSTPFGSAPAPPGAYGAAPPPPGAYGVPSPYGAPPAPYQASPYPPSQPYGYAPQQAYAPGPPVAPGGGHGLPHISPGMAVGAAALLAGGAAINSGKRV
ncbi:hypothetical protein BGZ46_004358 [Entomortierella lignicola]|nr:hypothetical protein BGZ46_004358 [Entomortierella lignicola]